MAAPSRGTHIWGQGREAAQCQSQYAAGNSLRCFLAASSVQRGHCKQTLAPLHLHSPSHACSLPPSSRHPRSSLHNRPYTETWNKRWKPHASALPPAHRQHISPQLPGQLSLLALYSSSQPTPAAALAPAPPNPLALSSPALPSPPSGPALAGSFPPITLPSPRVQTHWGWGHTCASLLQSSAQLGSTARAVFLWVDMGRDGGTVPQGRWRGPCTWSCFPQMTCVGALILLMFSWRECLDFSSAISKNTSGGKKRVSAMQEGCFAFPSHRGLCGPALPVSIPLVGNPRQG